MNHKGRFEYTKFENRRKDYYKTMDLLKQSSPSFEELVEDFPRFAGHMSISRYLTLYEMYKMSMGISGHIAEIGTYKGTSLLWFTKLLQIFEPESLTQVHGFDWFKGTDDDEIELKIEKGSYSYPYQNLIDSIEAQNLQNTCFVHELDITTQLEAFFIENPHLYFKVVFLDCGFYKVTKEALKNLWPRLNIGGVLILDQFNHELSPGEAMAVKEILPNAKIQTLHNSWMPTSYIIKT